MRDVGLADRRVVVLAVVGLVGQADAGLDEGDHVARRVVRVGAHVCADEASDALAHEAAHLTGELLVGGAGVDRVEVGAQGSGTGFFDGVLVEELSPQCGDAVRIRIVQRAIGCVLGDCARVLLGCVAQRVERPVHGAVCGDRVGRQPRAVDVAIEIVLWTHRRIDVRGVEDSGEQCVRHALTLGGEAGARGMSVHGTGVARIYVMSMGCNSPFSRGIVRGSADVSLMHPRRAHMCTAVCTFVQRGGVGA
ncbi:Uncharacterised protein [Mycobacteroides abscessus subsp. abscessus]|nr:Uncharacterised protein [Mycobacteroides abscessus subsp. abscessus]